MNSLLLGYSPWGHALFVYKDTDTLWDFAHLYMAVDEESIDKLYTYKLYDLLEEILTVKVN